MVEFETREENIDGIEKWFWPKHDTGLWTGPMGDWRNSHKQKVLKHCRNFRVVVQAGGGCGMYPRLLSNIFTYVYTFEPDETNFYCLTQNCYDRKIVKINAAVGAHKGLISVINGSETVNLGSHHVQEKENSYIPQLPVDSIKYPACDLLWFDVEGYESEALKGAMETIATHNPVLMVERAFRCEEFFTRLGYIEAEHSVADTIFVREKIP